MKFSKVRFWVQFYNLPVICMNREVGWFLGNQLVKVIEIDASSNGDYLGK